MTTQHQARVEPPIFKKRVRKLRLELAKAGFEGTDCFLVSAGSNIQYLCGFAGSYGFLIISADRAKLYTDGRYTAQARAQAQGVDVCESTQSPLDLLFSDLREEQVRRLAVEENRISHALYRTLRRKLRRTRVEPIDGLVEKLRLVKTPDEIAKIRLAARLNARAFDNVCSRARAEWTEARFAAELDFEVRSLGAEGPAFETIVASGPHSALPHARARPERIVPNSLVVLDHGAILDGYNSDMTRTICFGRVGSEQRRIFRAVREAQKAAVDQVRSGVKAATVDQAARKVLADFGYGDVFPHATGHGVGIEIHEQPRVGAGEQTRLASGMVITIEPGAYVEEVGGVRIEDLLLVTKTGCELLSRTSRQLRTL